MDKVKKELKLFKEFKKDYKFEQKEIVEKNGNKYCDDVLLKEGDSLMIGDSEKWVNVGFRFKGSFAHLLSNLYPYDFVFKGEKLSSLESFFQGIKYKDKKIQKMIFNYSGIEAVHLSAATNYNWKEDHCIYWQGKKYNRLEKEYDDLIDELYISVIQNPLYRSVLKKCDKDIIHALGGENKEETTFTRYEFEFELNCLKDFVKELDKDIND